MSVTVTNERDIMQLIYLYIDGYCNLHEVEFNFCQDLHLHFNVEKGVIEASGTDPHLRLPERFWGENINNLSVVIGNNGAGKTSLMQYLIDIFLEAHGGNKVGGQGILIFGEADTLYEYYNQNWRDRPISVQLESDQYKYVRRLNQADMESVLGKTKLIYLSNALSMRDSQRSQWYNSNRFNPFYDCSMGNLISSNIERDVNQNLRQGPMGGSETEAYFLYEQYKQIKFVFDRRQHQICDELKEKNLPVPVPKTLYIALLMGNQLSTVLDDVDIDFGQVDGEVERRIFQNLYPQPEHEQDAYRFLRKQLSRCAIWCAIRSAVRCMSGQEKEFFGEYLWKGNWNSEVNEKDYSGIFKKMWEVFEQVKEKKENKRKKSEENRNEGWEGLKKCYKYYIEFLDYIESEKLEEHFSIDTEEWDLLKLHPERKIMTFTVDTNDADWFMDFLKKYRYICNPDYFMDFRWGLSSGENSLLSLFASFYYIFDADFTNKKNGNYKIMNKFKQCGEVQCDSVILLIDEADLTYHPEWQRVFIALLTAFLPQVYPPQCCRDIQIVLSTHSPILLSDVPQQNVIYLKYDPEKRCTVVDDSTRTGTFGQNIHLLFKDSFFLEHGTIGLFAHRKINELVCNLKSIERSLEQDEKECFAAEKELLKNKLEYECRPYAELIAEPIIRRKVLMWIDTLQQKLSQDGQNDHQVQNMTDDEIEKELDRLQAELNRRKHDQNLNI